MGFSGRLEGIAPSDIFQIISQSRMTGTLIARCKEGTAMVVFKNGQVIEAASDASRESLGYLLVSQGLMSEETIAAARNRRKLEPDRLLGELLVEMGAITEQTLETVVLRQIGHIVHRLVACDDGFFTFDVGEMALKRKLNTHEFFIPAGVSAEYLLMERARTLDEERRGGSDRRASAARPPLEDEPAREGSRSTEAPGRSGAAAALRKLGSWLRPIRIPKAADAAVRKTKQIAGSAADLLHRHVTPSLRTAWNKARAFSPDGRVLVFVGIGGIAAGIILLLLAFQAAGSELRVTGRVVNVRAKPTTSSTVVAKVERDDTVSPVSTAKGWHEVRTKTGDTGWIWHTLVEQKKNSGLAVIWAMTGSGFVLVAGIALLIVGIMRRRDAAPGAPAVPREGKG